MNLCGDGVLATSGADKFVAIQQVKFLNFFYFGLELLEE